ncbi:MAG TPA: hypothetical protein DCY27_08505, partial [Desulfobacterales bacterium]|nr:hypothetical protein [Desulfobacterales bacterium]
FEGPVLGLLAGHKKGSNLLGWRQPLGFGAPGDTHDGRAPKKCNRYRIKNFQPHIFNATRN